MLTLHCEGPHITLEERRARLPDGLALVPTCIAVLHLPNLVRTPSSGRVVQRGPPAIVCLERDPVHQPEDGGGRRGVGRIAREVEGSVGQNCETGWGVSK